MDVGLKLLLKCSCCYLDLSVDMTLDMSGCLNNYYFESLQVMIILLLLLEADHVKDWLRKIHHYKNLIKLSTFDKSFSEDLEETFEATDFVNCDWEAEATNYWCANNQSIVDIGYIGWINRTVEFNGSTYWDFGSNDPLYSTTRSTGAMKNLNRYKDYNLYHVVKGDKTSLILTFGLSKSYRNEAFPIPFFCLPSVRLRRRQLGNWRGSYLQYRSNE